MMNLFKIMNEKIVKEAKEYELIVQLKDALDLILKKKQNIEDMYIEREQLRQHIKDLQQINTDLRNQNNDLIVFTQNKGRPTDLLNTMNN